MGIKKETWFIAVCDICGYKFEDGGEGIRGFNTKKSAREVIVGDCGWIIKYGKLICPWCVENEKI